MRKPTRHPESGFTLIELTVVVVISTIALIAIYQTLITQERTYRYQTAAIDAQGSTRVGLQLLASELREISASAGAQTGRAGSDLLVAARDSVRFRSFRKVGMACMTDRPNRRVDVWVPGAPFVTGDTLMVFLERDTLTDQDDGWVSDIVLSGASNSSTAACVTEWPTYQLQRLTGLGSDTLGAMHRGALIRSYSTMTYGAYQWESEWVLGRRAGSGEIVPLVGPLLPPEEGGLAFRYFDVGGTELTPTTEAARALVSRVEITVRALSRGGINNQNYVDSLTTNVYLRGN